MTRNLSKGTLLRAALIALAVLAFLGFFDGVQIAFDILARGSARWYDALPALAPFCAIAAAAIANTRLVLAGLLLVASLPLHFAPLLPFVLAVAIYGP